MVVIYSDGFLRAYRALPTGAHQDLLVIIDEVRTDDLSSLAQVNGIYRAWIGPGTVALGEIVSSGRYKGCFHWIGIVDPREDAGPP